MSTSESPSPSTPKIPSADELGFDFVSIRDKYREERDKRLRRDGNEQYQEIAGDFAHYDDDPYVAEKDGRAARTDEVDVLIIGGGFAGGGAATAAAAGAPPLVSIGSAAALPPTLPSAWTPASPSALGTTPPMSSLLPPPLLPICCCCLNEPRRQNVSPCGFTSAIRASPPPTVGGSGGGCGCHACAG